MPPFITLEDHMITRAYLDAHPKSCFNQPVFASTLSKLSDVADERYDSLVANSIDLQVISHAPHDADTELDNATFCAINDEMAAAVALHPDRYAAFAILPMHDAPAAVAELERCVKTLGFKGSLVDSHLRDGTFYDGPRFWEILAAHERLDVPLYIHPTFAESRLKEKLYAPTVPEGEEGGWSDATTTLLSSAGFGWHSMTALCVLRMFAAGVFEKFPKLQVVIGHDGEMLPFVLERSNKALGPRAGISHKRGLAQVWRENFWITTSGMWTLPPLACLLQTTSVDRVMFSVDYPFSTNEQGTKFMKELEASGLVTKEEFDMIGSGNAKRLLRL